MLNPASVAAVEAARFNEHFVRPLNQGYGFAALPNTITRLLSGSGAEGLPPEAFTGLPTRPQHVVLLLIDALGWCFFAPRMEAYPFLYRFVEHGIVSRLTTLFPSTTSAHVSTIHTGLMPSHTGIYEWFFYEPGLNRVIAPLLFSFAGDQERETLRAAGVEPQAIFPSDTLYLRLASHGVRSTVYQSATYAFSSFSKTACRGAKLVSFRTLAEAITLLEANLAAEEAPSYHMLYVDTVDALSHLYGPASAHVNAEIDTVLTTLDRLLHPALQRCGRETLLLLTADHGQVASDHSRVYMLNKLVPALEEATLRGADGRPIAPCGSSRDLFLHLKPERRDELRPVIAAALEGKAEVYPTEHLIDAGIFGPEVTPVLRQRLGNLVVLPYLDETVWWNDSRFPLRFKGMHGGLSRDEAHTQLAALGYF